MQESEEHPMRESALTLYQAYRTGAVLPYHISHRDVPVPSAILPPPSSGKHGKRKMPTCVFQDVLIKNKQQKKTFITIHMV